jgi:hypothetical protein
VDPVPDPLLCRKIGSSGNRTQDPGVSNQELKLFCKITDVTNQNLILEELKRRLNSGNACYHLVQNLLSSCLLSKNVKVRIYKTIILPMVLYGSETWSLTVREEHKLRVFENRVLRRIFGSKRDGVTGGC